MDPLEVPWDEWVREEEEAADWEPPSDSEEGEPPAPDEASAPQSPRAELGEREEAGGEVAEGGSAEGVPPQKSP